MSTTLRLSYPELLNLFGNHVVKQRTESRQFLAWFLENFYRLEESEVEDSICDGNYDKGVDGVYVNEQLSQIHVFQGRIVKGPKTLGDVSLKEFMGTVGQFDDERSVRNMQETTKNAELSGLLQAHDIAAKVAEG
jgi:hypothetical protein